MLGSAKKYFHDIHEGGGMKKTGGIFVPKYIKLYCSVLLKWLVHVFFITLLLSCDNHNNTDTSPAVVPNWQSETVFRVLFVNAYHLDYGWSDGIVSEVKRLFQKSFPCSVSTDSITNKVDLKVVSLIPAKNVTGILKVQLLGHIVATLKPHAKGQRIVFLKGIDLSALKEAAIFERKHSLHLDKIFVSYFHDWKVEFLKHQNSNW